MGFLARDREDAHPLIWRCYKNSPSCSLGVIRKVARRVSVLGRALVYVDKAKG